MSPLYIVVGILISFGFGYIIYRAAKKNPSGFVLQQSWLPTNAQPQTFKPEIEDGEGHTELLEEYPKPKHPNHKGDGKPHSI